MNQAHSVSHAQRCRGGCASRLSQQRQAAEGAGTGRRGVRGQELRTTKGTKFEALREPSLRDACRKHGATPWCRGGKPSGNMVQPHGAMGATPFEASTFPRSLFVGLHGPAARMRVNLRASKCATGERCWETDLSRRSLQAKADWFPLRATAFCSAPVLRRFWDWFELPPDLARAHSAKIGDNRASIPHWRELRSSSCLRSQFQTGPPPAPAVPKRRSTARTTKRCRDKGRPLS